MHPPFVVTAVLHISINSDGHTHVHYTGTSVVFVATACGSYELFPFNTNKLVIRGLKTDGYIALTTRLSLCTNKTNFNTATYSMAPTR